jgi:hypothetical protein
MLGTPTDSFKTEEFRVWALNQLPLSTRIENAIPEHVLDVRLRLPARLKKLG